MKELNQKQLETVTGGAGVGLNFGLKRKFFVKYCGDCGRELERVPEGASTASMNHEFCSYCRSENIQWKTVEE